MDRLWIDTRYEDLFRRMGWGTMASVMARLGEDLAVYGGRTRVTAKRVEGERGSMLEIFCKRYNFRRPSWRFWMRQSKGRQEFRNYGILEALGIACPERIACGEIRDGWGRLSRAFILTRAIPGVMTLSEYVLNHCADRAHPEQRAVRADVAKGLAETIRRLHARGFFHGDLYWRNLLVQEGREGSPKLWWIDSPRGRLVPPGPWRQRFRIKDLAALDLVAVELCSLSERVRFLRWYLGVPKLGYAGRALARAIVAYRHKRWPNKNVECRMSNVECRKKVPLH